MPVLIRSSILYGLLKLCREFELDETELMRQVGLDDSIDPTSDTLVPVSALLAFYQLLQTQLPNIPLSLLLGRHQGINDFGIIGQLMLSAETLQSAFDTAQRYKRLYVSDFSWPLNIDPPYAQLTFNPENIAQSNLQTLIETSIVQMYVILREITGNQWSPTEVCFRHSEPGNVQLYKDFFKTPIRYDAEFDGFWFSADFLNAPLPHASTLLHSTLKQFAESRAESLNKDQIVLLAKTHIKQGLAARQYKIQDIAKQLGMSTRTLQRKLNQHGQRFEQVVNDARIEQSCFFLKNSSLNISQVADLVGYRNTSTFSAFFKKATGLVPSAWAKQSSD